MTNLVSTFSIVALDSRNKDLGVAVESKYFSVGSVVPWAEAGVGAIATQARVNVSYGLEGLKLLAAGLSVSEVIDELTRKDPDRETRQLGVVDAKGNSTCFTGNKCIEWAGSKTGINYSVQGNILASENVVLAMAEQFESTEGELADRLMAALEAGQAAGGDSRGRQSAAIMVMRKGGGRMGYGDRYIDLRVEDHKEPIRELRRLLGLAYTHRLIQVSWEAVNCRRLGEALEPATKAVTLTPLNDEARTVLGLIRYLLGDEEASMMEFRQVLRINPNMKRMIEYYFKKYAIEDRDFLRKIRSPC